MHHGSFPATPKTFDWWIPTTIHFGGGLGGASRALAKKNVLVVSDAVLKKLGAVQKLVDSLQGVAGVHFFCDVQPNPTLGNVEEATQLARANGVDAVVGFGGGSALDVAKAVACMVGEEGPFSEFWNGERSFSNRRPLLVAIPTTAGTGSEVTSVGVYSAPELQAKKAIGSPHFWPDFAVVDPYWTLSVPPGGTVSTGLDAFSHALEAFWASSSQPLSQAFAREAMRTLFGNLETAFQDGSNEQARAALSRASLMAGMAFSQTRTTLLHAISYPLTAWYGVPHGLACIVTLRPVLEWVHETRPEVCEEVARAVGFPTYGEFRAPFFEWLDRLGVPKRLQELGIPETDIPRLAEESLKPPIVQLTPRVPSGEQMQQLFRSIF